MKIAKKRYLYHKLAKSVFVVTLLFSILTSMVFFSLNLNGPAKKPWS
jgi:hypothetical protein